MIDATKSSFVGGWDGTVRSGRDSLPWAVKTGRSTAAIIQKVETVAEESACISHGANLKSLYTIIPTEMSCDSRTRKRDLSIYEPPPLVASAVAEASIGPSNGPVSIPQTPTKGTALLSRINSAKKWRRKGGDSTAPTDANGMDDSTTRFSLTNTLLQSRVFHRARAHL
jgi:hypothetical protein